MKKVDWANFGLGIFCSKMPTGFEVALCLGFWEIVWAIERGRLVVARMRGDRLEFYRGNHEWTSDIEAAMHFCSAGEAFDEEGVFPCNDVWGIFAIDRYCSTEQMERELLDAREGMQ